MKRKKIIYIAGYSRSGSTILDILLGSHNKIFSTGELFYLFDDWLNTSRICTCGKPYSQCEFWKDLKILGIDFKDAINILRAVESRSSIKKLVNSEIPVAVIEKYKLIQTTLFDYIFSRSGKDIIVDSSKSSRDMAGRFYALHLFSQYDVYVLHLLKNGLSIVKSYVEKGRNWTLEGHSKNDKFLAARASFGWRLANKHAFALGTKLPSTNYLSIHYEDLVNDPEKIFKKIGLLLGEDFSDVIDNIKNNYSFLANHNIGGNRLRLENEIKLIPTKPVQKVKIDIISKITFNIIAGNLNKKIGY